MAGTGGHLEAYAHNIPAFAQRYRVIAYDYPGHGYTTHATADLELPDYVEHLAGLMDALSIDAAHLNGESLGGWVAVKFAASVSRPAGQARAEHAGRHDGTARGHGTDPRPVPGRRRRSHRGADPGPAGVADGRPARRSPTSSSPSAGRSTPSQASPSRCGTSCACRTRRSAAATSSPTPNSRRSRTARWWCGPRTTRPARRGRAWTWPERSAVAGSSTSPAPGTGPSGSSGTSSTSLFSASSPRSTA